VPLFNPNIGGVPVAPDRRCWVSARAQALSYSAVKLFSKNSNLCVHGTWTLQTNRQTDGQLTVASLRSALASRGKKIIIIIDRSRFVRQDLSSPVKKNVQISGHSERGHLVLICAERRRPRPLTSKETMQAPGSTDGRGGHKAWLARFFSDVWDQIRFDWERGAFRLDRSRFVRFWKRTQPIMCHNDRSYKLTNNSISAELYKKKTKKLD